MGAMLRQSRSSAPLLFEDYQSLLSCETINVIRLYLSKTIIVFCPAETIKGEEKEKKEELQISFALHNFSVLMFSRSSNNYKPLLPSPFDIPFHVTPPPPFNSTSPSPPSPSKASSSGNCHQALFQISLVPRGYLEDPEVAKFREQDLKFLPEMEFLFKGTIVTGFASYAPSEDSRQNEGFNTRMKETNDNIDNNTKIDMTTQIMSSAKESGQRKRA
ncbi:hypothetical protein JHK86_050782 [Glycine max]|nr:hypothetical protein JHK86_050782 [Glycine max]